MWGKREKKKEKGRERIKKFSGRKRERVKKSAVRVGISFLNGLSFLHHACVYVNMRFVWMLPKAGVVKPVHAILTIIGYDNPACIFFLDQVKRWMWLNDVYKVGAVSHILHERTRTSFHTR